MLYRLIMDETFIAANQLDIEERNGKKQSRTKERADISLDSREVQMLTRNLNHHARAVSEDIRPIRHQTSRRLGAGVGCYRVGSSYMVATSISPF